MTINLNSAGILLFSISCRVHTTSQAAVTGAMTIHSVLVGFLIYLKSNKRVEMKILNTYYRPLISYCKFASLLKARLLTSFCFSRLLFHFPFTIVDVLVRTLAVRPPISYQTTLRIPTLTHIRHFQPQLSTESKRINNKEKY